MIVLRPPDCLLESLLSRVSSAPSVKSTASVVVCAEAIEDLDRMPRLRR